jgi:hypothetical protein
MDRLLRWVDQSDRRLPLILTLHSGFVMAIGLVLLLL